MIREYYRLTKPGIIYGNALATVAGFFIGAQGDISIERFLLTLLGTCLVVASGCVFNNYIDRDIDAKMERTKNRALVQGSISTHNAVSFGILLAILGSASLYLVNVLALLVGFFGLFAYVILYSLWCKRHTLHATTIGAISGAIPPVIGYAGASNSIDLGALLVFLILFTWQVPHALAIAIRRIEDYRAANIPIMPIKLGMFRTQLLILLYAVVFLLACVALYMAGYAGVTFVTIMSVLGIVWIALCVLGFRSTEPQVWTRKVFRFSLILICAFCVLAAFNSLLP